MLSFIGVMVIYPMIAKKIDNKNKKPESTDNNETQPTASKKPKAYYQFWAAHVIILALLIYTLKSVNLKITFYIGFIFGLYALMSILTFLYIFGGDKFNTPTHFYTCNWLWKKICSILITIASLFMVTVFISLCIIALPTVIFIYYLYPAHTLIRLPFIINSILYINSLLALLLFQCERICYTISKRFWYRCKNKFCNKSEDEEFYDMYYKEIYEAESWKKGIGPLLTYYAQPLLTSGVLTILVLFVRVLADLFRLHHDHFTDKNQVETLILLVPTLLLLFGSWWKLDVFFDIKEPKSKKELLHEILDELKSQRCTHIEMETPTNHSDAESQPAADIDQDTATRHVPSESSRLLLHRNLPAGNHPTNTWQMYVFWNCSDSTMSYEFPFLRITMFETTFVFIHFIITALSIIVLYLVLYQVKDSYRDM